MQFLAFAGKCGGLGASGFADGSAGGFEPGSVTFDLCRDLVDRYVLVSEAEIADAIRWMVRHHHKIIEGAAGVALAACINEQERLAGKTVAVVGARDVAHGIPEDIRVVLVHEPVTVVVQHAVADVRRAGVDLHVEIVAVAVVGVAVDKPHVRIRSSVSRRIVLKVVIGDPNRAVGGHLH